LKTLSFSRLSLFLLPHEKCLFVAIL